MRFLTTVMCLIVGIAVFHASGFAAEIEVDDPRWLRLPNAEKSALEKRLKAGGALGPDDKIVFKGAPDNSITEKNVALGIALAQIAKGLCKSKTLAEQANCAKKPEGERPACRAAETARYERTKTLCK